MKRTGALLLAGTLALAAGAAAQDWRGMGRLEGRVTDEKGTPIADATVKLGLPSRGGGGTTVKSDKKGHWAVAGLASGAWNVDVDAAGFTSKKLSVNLAAEGARVPPVEVKLEKAAAAGAPPEVMEAVAKAEEAYKAGRYEEAIAAYNRLLELRPDVATTVHQQIGFSLVRLKKYAEGLEHLQKVLDADPTNVPIRAIMAQAALEGGMLDRGLELLKGVDEASVKSPDVFFNIGVNLINANRPEDAIAYFGKAIALDAAYADGYFRRGLAYLQLGKTAEAKGDLQKFVGLQPAGAQADLARKALDQIK